jgi:hypothetical protein
MIAAWPWASLEFLNPVRAIFAFAHFHYPIRTFLAGEMYDMATVPRWYVPAYVVIKLPLVTFVGVFLAAVLAAAPGIFAQQRLAPGRRAEIAFIAFTVAFPLLCQVIGSGPAFTGMRHFLFVAPPLAVLAGIGLDAALTSLRQWRPIAVRLAGVAICVTAGWNALDLIRLHPDQYLYYNALVGGLEGASRRYDTDYWVNIMPEAVDNLEGFLKRSDRDYPKPGHRYTVAVCGERLPFEREADPQLKWTEDWARADFFIAPTHMNCDRVLDGKIIATIERLGVPIGVVKDRRTITRPSLAIGR